MLMLDVQEPNEGQIFNPGIILIPKRSRRAIYLKGFVFCLQSFDCGHAGAPPCRVLVRPQDLFSCKYSTFLLIYFSKPLSYRDVNAPAPVVKIHACIQGCAEKVPGFKGVAKGLVGGPTFRVLLQGLEKLKVHCNKGVN
ncbi:uncharacterized protein LOC128250035 [Octopus bimaculoides]|uniref:uncharacterized protein LOC128250035 n=1 Tax=Octopus bimaculoides TaxID=37653 RepID=UPI0022E0DD66|nr:uncharacterized protein LOC128250035 [Octopus bimaculoides]